MEFSCGNITFISKGFYEIQSAEHCYPQSLLTCQQDETSKLFSSVCTVERRLLPITALINHHPPVTFLCSLEYRVEICILKSSSQARGYTAQND